MDRVKLAKTLCANAIKKMNCKDFAYAEASFQLALKLVPESPDALIGLALVAQSFKKHSEAESFLMRALKQKAASPRLFYELSKACFNQFKVEKSLEAARKGADLLGMRKGADTLIRNPDLILDNLLLHDHTSKVPFDGRMIHYHMRRVVLECEGHVNNLHKMRLMGLDPFDKTQKEVPEIVCLASDENHDYARTLGAFALIAEGIQNYSLAEHLNALSLQIGEREDVLNNMVLILMNTGRREEASVYGERLLKHPNYKQKKSFTANLAHVKLGLKHFEKGWEYYESRASLNPSMALINLPKELLWQGNELPKGERLIFITEQGFGDNIFFGRYILYIHEKYPDLKLSFICPKPLSKLFKESFPFLEVFSNPKDSIESIKNCKHFCYIASLPGVLKITDKTIPYAKGYIKPNPILVDKTRNLFPKNRKLRIGFTFSTRKASSLGWLQRAIPKEYFLKLLEIPNVELYSFQVDYARKELRPYAKEKNLYRLGDKISSYSETAALLQHIDLVITPDTSLIHIAGATNVPFWVILPVSRDWKWFLDEETTPWYTSARLFTQKKIGCWDEPFEEIYMRVEELAKAKEENKSLKDRIYFQRTAKTVAH